MEERNFSKTRMSFESELFQRRDGYVTNSDISDFWSSHFSPALFKASSNPRNDLRVLSRQNLGSDLILLTGGRVVRGLYG